MNNPPHPFTGRAHWIWSAESSYQLRPTMADTHYGVRRFRCAFQVGQPTSVQLTVSVSADSRYLLFCNGQRVGRGPAKGDVFHQFYDTYDLRPWLQAGENVLAALVLDFSKIDTHPPKLGAPTSVMTHAGGFILDGELRDTEGTVLASLATHPESPWKVQVDTAYRFQNEQNLFGGFVGYFEHFISRLEPRGWTQPGFDDCDWESPAAIAQGVLLAERCDCDSAYGLLPRLIPPLEEERVTRFADSFQPGGAPLEAARAWVLDDQPLTVPPHQELRLVLDVGTLTTAYPMLTVEQGSGSVIRLTYAEAFRLPVSTPDARLLRPKASQSSIVAGYSDESSAWTFDRRGTIVGWCDIYEPSGERDHWEPFHWRTFQFIELRVQTADEPLLLCSIRHRFTAYPFKEKACFRSAEPRHERYWDVSVRTMRLCTHETFEDCPYYEQMQYAGDTEVTSRLAMMVSGDARLTRQALYHFDWSRMPEGITQSRYPSRLNQIIPSFSLHWITMARDYFLFTGDRQTIGDLLPGMHAVLSWFRRHKDASGLPARLPYWNCVDWCTDWQRGVPPGWDTGPTCIISAQYLYALRQVQWMESFFAPERRDPTLEHEIDQVRQTIGELFWSEDEGLFYDRPHGPELSQLGNAWAVLADVASPGQRRRLRERFPADGRLSRAAFFGRYFVIRALRALGADEAVHAMLTQWDEMLELGLSTWAEETTYWRSLCHAWSAHPILDFLTEILGIQPREPGFAKILVAPRPQGLAWAEGAIESPRGRIAVRWAAEGEGFRLQVQSPPDTPTLVVLPSGQQLEFPGGTFENTFALAGSLAIAPGD